MSEPHPYCTEHDQPLEWCRHPPEPQSYLAFPPQDWDVVRRLADALLAGSAGQPPAHQPCRGSDVEAWLKRLRDDQPEFSDPWLGLDVALDDYRERADTGTPLLDEIRRHDQES